MNNNIKAACDAAEVKMNQAMDILIAQQVERVAAPFVIASQKFERLTAALEQALAIANRCA